MGMPKEDLRSAKGGGSSPHQEDGPRAEYVEMSQWSMEEELYVSYHHQGPRAGGRGSLTWSLLGGLVKLGIVSGGFVGLKKPFSSVYINLMNGHLSGYSAKVLV